jgi:MFS family permease
MSSMSVFTLMWGLPYLVYGVGYPRAEASALLVVTVVTGVVTGPFLGVLTARFPLRRSNLVLAIVAFELAVWALTLAWPGRPPLAVIILLLVAIGVGGPGSAIGFDFARSFNPLHALGSANGVVNVGGFSAAFIMMYLIGVLLDVAHGVWGFADYSLNSFRVAFLVQFVVIGAGVIGLVHARRRTRRRMHDEEGIQVAPLWVSLSAAWARRRAARG